MPNQRSPTKMPVIVFVPLAVKRRMQRIARELKCTVTDLQVKYITRGLQYSWPPFQPGRTDGPKAGTRPRKPAP